MRTVLTEVSNLLLEENQKLDAITLMIDLGNKNSRKTAEASGFITDGQKKNTEKRDVWFTIKEDKKVYKSKSFLFL